MSSFITQSNIITLMLAVVGVPLLFLLISRLRFSRKATIEINTEHMRTINERFNNIWDEVETLKMQYADTLKDTQEIPKNVIRKVRKSVKKGKR